MASELLAGLNILVIEDEVLLRKQILAHLEALGADALGVGTLQDARRSLAETSFDFSMLDLQLADGRGDALLEEKAFSSNTGVIVMTADATVRRVVDCMRLGALDYLVKPFDVAELPLVISRARRARQSARLEEHRRESELSQPLFFGKTLAGLQQHLEKILEADRRIEQRLPPVLIEGETGTGKTAVARWLHNHGPRARQPLVEINCSAVPENLAESELFGHERGAFTDARTAKLGLFEAADGGTLLLDELPSLSIGLQSKVLKVIEDHRLRRLGGTRELGIDVRIIAATNRDMKKLVAAGQFREDLLHRLDLYRIELPPLRARGDDILTLADELLARVARRHRLLAKSISAAGRRRLLSYSWPGNVRELAHELERAMVFETGEELQLEALLAATPVNGMPGLFDSNFRIPEQGFELDKVLGQLIQRALEQSGHNVSGAARLLGVTRDYLRYHLGGQKLDESPPKTSS